MSSSKGASYFLKLGWSRVASCALLLSFLSLPAWGQDRWFEIPASTPLSIELIDHVPMKAGQPLLGRLLYPIYVANQLAVPQGTVLHGTVTRLNSATSRRIHSRLRGDFTPFHNPVVRFDTIDYPDGTRQTFSTSETAGGAQLVSLSPPPGKASGSFIRRELAAQIDRLRANLSLFTAPGKADRLLQFFYSQLPYHPERIEAKTAWTVELASPLRIRQFPEPTSRSAAKHTPGSAGIQADESESQEWRLHAYLLTTISSGLQKPGDTFEAKIAEPVFNGDQSLAVPQGAVLVGKVTQAKRARSFGRSGKLRFRFTELRLPTGSSKPVEGTLRSIDSDSKANLGVDSEGGVQPQAQNRVIVPLVLTLLAGRALSDDGSQALNSGIASNGFGLAGRLTGVLASSREVAAGIGFYAAALSVYDLWLAPGRDVSFAKYTRIEVTTANGRSRLASPLGQQKNKHEAREPR